MYCHGAMQFPCFYQVRFSTDPDKPVALVPSCCVWTGNGLSTVPAKAGTDSATLALQRVAGEPLGCSSTACCLCLHRASMLCAKYEHMQVPVAKN